MEFDQNHNRLEAIIQDHNNCPLCGQQLDFKHNVNMHFNRITEEAECTSCNIKIKTSEHGLQ